MKAVWYKYLKLILSFFAASLLAYIYFKYDPINNILFPKCPLYATTGIYCPGCGSQRATHALLNFNIIDVFRSNFLFLPAFGLLFYHYVIQAFNYFFEKKYISILDKKNAPKYIFVIVILYWILRNIPYWPFTFLAPEL